MRNRAISYLHSFAAGIVLLPVMAMSLDAQGYVVVTCRAQGGCLYHATTGFTVQGKNTVRTITAEAANDPKFIQKARSVRLDLVPGLYKDPTTGTIRILGKNLHSGDVVLPAKMSTKPGAGVSSTWDGVALEYRDRAKTKSGVPVPMENFVALLGGPVVQHTAFTFLQAPTSEAEINPIQQQLIAGAVVLLARSTELQSWRNDLRKAMRDSVEKFKDEKGDPTLLEATLKDGLGAVRVYRLIAAENEGEEALQTELNSNYDLLLKRFAVASALMNASLHDAFLDKLEQIGLARWSKPALVSGVELALKASAEMHYKLAKELFIAKQFGRAFDEAQMASRRAPCDPLLSEYFYFVRVEFVNKNMIATLPEYENENRSILRQIVRELQGIGQESALTPERVEYARRRIAEGERIDKNYLPLQFKKAEFLANVGELTAAREVVIRVERTVQLDSSQAEEWLHLDASLNGKLTTTRERAERLVADAFKNGQFKEALDEGGTGLRAEPSSPKLLYFGALASAVLRNRELTKDFVERYLRFATPGCINQPEATKTLFDLYRSYSSRQTVSTVEGKAPHWISGEPYRPGEVFYDPLSGGFFPRVTSIFAEKGSMYTEFHWEGFMATAITTSIGRPAGADTRAARERTIFEAEPRYDHDNIHMISIGSKANSTGERRDTLLRYLNSPDFDPLMAARFTGKAMTRGWSGNPFFHPFIWTGIFIFDLSYDEQGRIKDAVPVAPDSSHPRSPMSETLHFTWDGNSKRLLSITGTRYRREMQYDNQGRLKSEKITYPSGKGKIEYEYRGNSTQLRQAKCDDSFYDKTRRLVYFGQIDQ